MMVVVRRFGILVAFALVGVYAAVMLRGPQGILALKQKRSEIRDLQEQNATLSRENQRKRERIELLKKDPEIEIRTELKLLRPAETTFILPEKPASAKDPARVPEPAATSPTQ
jgi:cell division protein FtsB